MYGCIREFGLVFRKRIIVIARNIFSDYLSAVNVFAKIDLAIYIQRCSHKKNSYYMLEQKAYGTIVNVHEAIALFRKQKEIPKTSRKCTAYTFVYSPLQP